MIAAEPGSAFSSSGALSASGFRSYKRVMRDFDFTRLILAAALAVSLSPSGASAQRSKAVPWTDDAPAVDGGAIDRDVASRSSMTEGRAPRAAVRSSTVRRSPLAPPARVVDNTRMIAAGDILIDTRRRRLYYAIDDDRMKVYPVAVGKTGASWSGTALVGRKAVNPTWHPTENQRSKRRLPRSVGPGRANPLGIRAIYLFQDGRDTLYRIHGTNQPSSIGKSVSAGCIRMRNADVADLYSMVDVGAEVTVI